MNSEMWVGGPPEDPPERDEFDGDDDWRDQLRCDMAFEFPTYEEVVEKMDEAQLVQELKRLAGKLATALNQGDGDDIGIAMGKLSGCFDTLDREVEKFINDHVAAGNYESE